MYLFENHDTSQLSISSLKTAFETAKFHVIQKQSFWKSIFGKSQRHPLFLFSFSWDYYIFVMTDISLTLFKNHGIWQKLSDSKYFALCYKM